MYSGQGGGGGVLCYFFVIMMVREYAYDVWLLVVGIEGIQLHLCGCDFLRWMLWRWGEVFWCCSTKGKHGMRSIVSCGEILG
jgi:hypothetical protein